MSETDLKKYTSNLLDVETRLMILADSCKSEGKTCLSDSLKRDASTISEVSVVLGQLRLLQSALKDFVSE